LIGHVKTGFSLEVHGFDLDMTLQHCSIADIFSYKVIEALSKMSNQTDAIAACQTVGSKMTPCANRHSASS